MRPLFSAGGLAGWLLGGLLLAQIPALQARTWTFAPGDPPLDAELVELKKETVVLDPGNRSFLEIPLSAFSPGDQEFIRNAPKAPPPAPPLVKSDPEVAPVLAPGSVLARIARGETKISYCVYIPKTFQAATPPPIIIGFDPGGRGLSLLNALKASAEKAGWLLVGCDNLRNGMNDDLLQGKMEDEVLADIRRVLPHNPNRIYLAGLSGGAMRCYGIANRFKLPFAGIIGYGGWMGGAKFQAKSYCPNMAVAMIYGEEDDAKVIGPSDAEALKRSQCTSRQFLWPGGHAISPPAVTDEAIAWLEEQWKARP